MSAAFRATRGSNFVYVRSSPIYPNMCAKFGLGPTVMSKKGGVQKDRQPHKGTLQLYIVDSPPQASYF